MKKYFGILPCLLLAIGGVCGNAFENGATPHELHLAKNSRALLPIVIAADSGTAERAAAEVLKQYLDRISGGDFAIQTDDRFSGGAAIHLKTATTNRIQVDGDVLLVSGMDGQALTDSVYAFLEEDAGCRWYGDQDIVIPQDADLTVFVTSRDTTASFRQRLVYTDYALCQNSNWTEPNRVQSWAGKFNHIENWFCHTYENIVGMGEFADSPELFAQLPNGNRLNTQLCPSHPEVEARAVTRMLAALRNNRNPASTLISLTENDGSTGYCQCATCRLAITANAAPIAPHLTLVNRVARQIAPEFPAVKIDFLVYSQDFRNPPTEITMEPNVAMWFCVPNASVINFFAHDPEQVKLFDAWQQIVGTTLIWEYSVDYSNYFHPVPSLPAKVANLKFWKSREVDGIMFLQEVGAPIGGLQQLEAWVLAKLLWNCERDADALARDFCNGVYGAAADEVMEYYQLISAAGKAEKSLEEFYGTAAFIAAANEIFARAVTQAGDDALLLAKLERLALPVSFLELETLYHSYPLDRAGFPRQHYAGLLRKTQDIIDRCGMENYSELRTLAGRFAELELLCGLETNGVLSIYAVNGRLYGYPVRPDPLAATGQAPLLPCTSNWLVQWEIPCQLLEPERPYQVRAQLRSVNSSSTPGIAVAAAGVSRHNNSPATSLVRDITGAELAPDQYRWIEIGSPFVPTAQDYIWFAALAGADIGGMFVDKIELIPMTDEG